MFCHVTRFKRDREGGFKPLLQALRTNTSVVRLDLSNCTLRIDANSCPLLVEILQENKTLKDVYLNLNFMSDEALLALCGCLKNNRRLETLSIMMRGKGPGVGVWQQFVLGLKENSRLTELNMFTPIYVHREIEAVNETRQQQGLPLLRVY